MLKNKIKVLIVEDSTVVQTILLKILEESSEIEVVGFAENPIIARQKIKELNPDVITLDIEMPEMDGITFLRKLMKLRPIPVVMVSTLTEANSPKALEALSIGAIDCIAKPKTPAEISNISNELISKIKLAKKANLFHDKYENSSKHQDNKFKDDFVIAIGSSTGGIPALEKILKDMPTNCPPILIVQHIKASFAKSLVSRLNDVCNIKIEEAKNLKKLEKGAAYIASEDKHIELKSKNGSYIIYTNDKPPVTMHKPSVDVMFESVASSCGAKSVGVILTGMGKDGAEGLLKIKKAGAYTIGQSESSCVVYGMPRAAYEKGAVIDQMNIEKVSNSILDYLTV